MGQSATAAEVARGHCPKGSASALRSRLLRRLHDPCTSLCSVSAVAWGREEAWKDADPDIPILKQAKAQYAELRSENGITY
jgi:hypothetical protein